MPVEVAYGELRGLACTGSRVVQKQQQCVLTLTLRGEAFGSGEQRVHLRPVQTGDGRLENLLEGDQADLAAPLKVFGAVLTDKPCERVNATEALIAGTGATTARAFQMREKQADPLRGQVGHDEPIDWLLDLLGHKRQQLGEHVAIAPLGVQREIAFADQVFE